jgi:hypothetical protein
MSLEQILVGSLAILIGAAFCFAGFKWFLILLPIWGFLAGFVFGSNLMYNISANDGFFVTAAAILIGVVAGAAFALFSYLYYYFAVILLGGSIGYLLGIGVMDLFNITGWLAFIVGIVVAAVFAYGFIVLHMPAAIAVWGTALAGAMAIVAGVALIIDRVELASLNTGLIGAALADAEWPWLWIGAIIVLAIAGAVAQIRVIGGTLEAITKDQYSNPGMA